MTTVDPTAFDAFAEVYDDEFTDSRLGRILRERVWEVLGDCFPAGSSVLELTCGTGEDAVWLAQRGVHITATDGSVSMVQVAQNKADRLGLDAYIQVKHLPLQDVATSDFQEPFDGVFSNFGGLNTIGEWDGLAKWLAGVIRPGGKAVLVPMGPICPIETLWYLLRGQPKVAMRRFNQPALAQIGNTQIPIWYPSARRFKKVFDPHFRSIRTMSLGLFLPPSYLGHWVDSRPGLFDHLNKLEQTLTPLTGGWGDHYILVLERKRDEL